MVSPASLHLCHPDRRVAWLPDAIDEQQVAKAFGEVKRILSLLKEAANYEFLVLVGAELLSHSLLLKG